jgi:hypothetical protein
MNLDNIYSKMIEESWGALSMRQPNNAKGVQPPLEAKNQYTAQQVKFGTTEMNPITINTFEQEEDVSISKYKVLEIIDKHIKHLDPNNSLDKSGLLHFSLLKKDLMKL